MIQRRARSKSDGDLIAVDGLSFTVRPVRSPGAGLREPARLLRWPFGLPPGSADSFHPGSISVPSPIPPERAANQPPVHPPQGGAPMRPGP